MELKLDFIKGLTQRQDLFHKTLVEEASGLDGISHRIEYSMDNVRFLDYILEKMLRFENVDINEDVFRRQIEQVYREVLFYSGNLSSLSKNSSCVALTTILLVTLEDSGIEITDSILKIVLKTQEENSILYGFVTRNADSYSNLLDYLCNVYVYSIVDFVYASDHLFSSLKDCLVKYDFLSIILEKYIKGYLEFAETTHESEYEYLFQFRSRTMRLAKKEEKYREHVENFSKFLESRQDIPIRYKVPYIGGLLRVISTETQCANNIEGTSLKGSIRAILFVRKYKEIFSKFSIREIINSTNLELPAIISIAKEINQEELLNCIVKLIIPLIDTGAISNRSFTHGFGFCRTTLFSNEADSKDEIFKFGSNEVSISNEIVKEYLGISELKDKEVPRNLTEVITLEDIQSKGATFRNIALCISNSKTEDGDYGALPIAPLSIFELENKERERLSRLNLDELAWHLSRSNIFLDAKVSEDKELFEAAYRVEEKFFRNITESLINPLEV